MPIVGGTVIAAAGLGSRLGHGLPKCMVEVGGKTILSRLIEEAESLTDRVHVVVGYREDLIIQHCALHHRDVILVRNPEFRTTQTIHSYRLGARGLAGQALFIDGDCLIAPGELEAFISSAQGHETYVGLTPARSDHAVFASVRGSGDDMEVVGFNRDSPEPQEWASVLVASASILEGHDNFVYEALTSHLPIAAGMIDLAEVDTADDLQRAHAQAAAWWPGD